MSNACDTGNDACSTDAKHGNSTECCDIPEKLLCLADEAWREVVKEKIKKEIEKTAGPKLDTLAKLVAETNHRKWAHLIEAKKGCDDYRQSVKDVLTSLNQ